MSAVKGRMGTVTMYNKAGATVLRVGRNDVRYKSSPARLLQQQKFSLANQFVKAFSGSGFFNTSYAGICKPGYGSHRAVSAIMQLAVANNGQGPQLQYENILLSCGLLPPASQPGQCRQGRYSHPL